MRHILLSLAAASLLAGCGDPLRNFARLSDVTVAEGTAAVAESPPDVRRAAGRTGGGMGGGLFGRLLNRTPEDPTNAAIEAALVDLGVDTEAEATPEAEPQQAEPAPAAQDAPTRRGLLSRVFSRGTPEAARTGPDKDTVGPGTVLPFGQIARVCDVRGTALGRQIDSGAGYKLFDTIPNTTAPRPFYITGFDDNCARTFTGAVVVTGDVETHEFVRYRPSNERIDYTSTDNAYEALKASVCRVGRGQPCGSETQRLNRDTQFITVYNFFGGTFSAVPTKWAQILVHDGEVLAMSIKDGQ